MRGGRSPLERRAAAAALWAVTLPAAAPMALPKHFRHQHDCQAIVELEGISCSEYDKDANDTEIRGRYVFLGNEQTRGVNYDETYSPTGRPATQRCCHAVASSEKLIAKQADVKAAEAVAWREVPRRAHREVG